MMRRILATCVLASMVAAGCGALREDAPAAASASATPSSNDVLIVSGDGGTQVIDARGRVVADLGKVIVAPNGQTAATVTPSPSGTTSVQVLDAMSGAKTRTVSVPGEFRPVARYASGPSGFSANGRWLVLTNNDGSAFAVLDMSGQEAMRTIRTPPSFSFDAMSGDGFSLYLVEHLASAPSAYRVRVADVTMQKLLPDIIVDGKLGSASPDGRMDGIYTTSLPVRDGDWFFSVYQHPAKGPFIHALNVKSRIAQCILDLPTFGKATPLEMSKQPFWSLANGQRGALAEVYAVNGALGKVAAIDPYEVRVTKSATIKVPSASGAGSAYTPLPGAVVSPDGYRLYAVAERGIVLIDTSDLALRATFAASEPFRAVAVSASNATLYALAADGLSIAALDARTGRPVGTITLAAPAASIAIQKR